MLRLDEPGPAPAHARGAALAFGNFDGVHLGHQAIVASAAQAARARGRKLGAAVFLPHPREVFQPGAPPFRLQSPAQRARALEALGVDLLFEIGFDHALAGLSDVDFAQQVLVARLGAAHVSVGFDFRFGRQRMGDAASLQRLGGELGFSVSVVPPVSGAHGEKISSTAIRAAIGEGRMEDAAALLGRPWAIEGLVGPGQARGRTIGFPTANLALGGYARPRLGVYAATADLGDGLPRPAVVNIGVRPTLGAADEPLLEAHLLDFSGDLYGRRVEVALRLFIRPERKFDGLDALKAQIALDAEAARAAL